MPIPFVPLSDAELFNSVNLALPAWTLLIVAPRWRGTQIVVKATVLAFAALYVATIVPQLANGGLQIADLFSFEGCVKAFATKTSVLPGTLHWVTFDLWTARWEARICTSCQLAFPDNVVSVDSSNLYATLLRVLCFVVCRWKTPKHAEFPTSLLSLALF